MKMLFLELNEFSLSLLEKGAEELNLKQVKKLLLFHKSQTTTDDTYEEETLEPWVQWVSVHTSISFSEHKIKHLGDVPHLKNPQIWEELSEMGISSGIWGPMNASKGNSEKTLFFLPDPWTFSEEAFPNELDSLLSLLRYVSKNYTKKKLSLLLKKGGSFLIFLKRKKLLGFFFRQIPSLVFTVFKHPKKPFAFISFLDRLSTRLFLKYQKTHNPDFSILFLNSLAHIQHHQWKEGKITKNSPVGHGLIQIDQILKELFSSMDSKTCFVVTNALSQVSTEKDPPWVLYRQIDQAEFLKAIGIEKVRVESHMTHDAHLFFASEQKAIQAKGFLEKAIIQGKKLFLVESYLEDPKKLFYKIIFTDKVSQDEKFFIEKQEFLFFSLFCKIVQRTGKHIQSGTLFSSKDIFPSYLYNHEISSYVKKSFLAKKIEEKTEAEEIKAHL